MAEGTWSFLFVLVAVFILFFCIFGITGHICILTTLLRKCQWKDKPGLVLILSLTISDTIRSVCWGMGALLGLLNWHPAVLQKWLPIPISMGWTSLCLHLVTMAVNRFVAVCIPTRFESIFSKNTTQKLVIFLWFCIFSINVPYVVNCCTLYYDFDRLVSTYDFNHTMMWYFQLHATILGTVSTIVPSVLYCCVALNLYLLKRGFDQSTIDVSLCWQFFIILFCHLVATTAFQMVPKIADQNGSLLFLIPVCAAINLSINPVVYFVWNETIRTAFKEMITRNNVVHVQPAIQLNQLPVNGIAGE